MVKSFTSASANKFLRLLVDEKEQLLWKETYYSTYIRVESEDLEAPAYDYEATRTRIAEINRQEHILRHALHKFNVNTKLPDSDLTIDEALIVLAQLSREQHRLSTMREKQPKARTRRRPVSDPRDPDNCLFEYEYANYDIERVASDYQALTERICDLQLKIDLCNHTVAFGVDL